MLCVAERESSKAGDKKKKEEPKKEGEKDDDKREKGGEESMDVDMEVCWSNEHCIQIRWTEILWVHPLDYGYEHGRISLSPF